MFVCVCGRKNTSTLGSFLGSQWSSHISVSQAHIDCVFSQMSITAHKTVSARLVQRVRATGQLDVVLAAWIYIYHTHSENNIRTLGKYGTAV